MNSLKLKIENLSAERLIETTELSNYQFLIFNFLILTRSALQYFFSSTYKVLIFAELKS
jgi:hypothetical protein